MTTPEGALGVPQNRAVGRALPALPPGTAVRVDGNLKCYGKVVSHEVIQGNPLSVQYLILCTTGSRQDKKEKVSGQDVFRTDEINLTHTATIMAPSRSAMHFVFFDPEDVAKPDSHLVKFAVAANDDARKLKKTARGLKLARETHRTSVFGTGDQPALGELIFGVDEEFTQLAQMRVATASYNAAGLQFEVRIWCNAKHRAMPYDLMEVYLDFEQDTILDTVAVIVVPADKNTVKFTAAYTWEQLAALLHLQVKKGDVAQTLVTGLLGQIGIRTVWLDATDTSTSNSINHYSGGLDGKHGTGVVSLRPITLDDLKAAEGVPKLNWNAAEPLRGGRPVYDTFIDLLQPAKELATTLEAESEYQVDEVQFASVLIKMEKLTSSEQMMTSQGIKKCETVKVECFDDYYDTADFDLLKRKIVLRRRRVPANDKAGVFLFACKGATFVHPTNRKEKIRLATQCQLIEGFSMPRLVKFLTDDENIDNAFARVLKHALESEHQQPFRPEKWGTLDKRFCIHSKRVKYSLELDYATTIEFSADEATIEGKDSSITTYSIEFGVGHPGLQVLNTQPSSAPSGQGGMSSSAPRMGRAEKILIQRPYHVPSDLANPDLFGKPDYIQYQKLRDQLLMMLFGSTDPALEPGGNKAHTLASLHKLI